MFTYRCDICGKIETAKKKLSAKALGFDFCCHECNDTFVKAAKATDIDDLDRQLIMLMKCVDEDRVPQPIIDLINRVVKYQTEIFIEETNNTSIEELEDELDEIIKKKEHLEYKKLNDEMYPTSSIIKLLYKALDNAIDNEFYEAAHVINERLKDIKKG